MRRERSASTSRGDRLAMLSRLEWLVIHPRPTPASERWFAWLSADGAPAFVVSR